MSVRTNCAANSAASDSADHSPSAAQSGSELLPFDDSILPEAALAPRTEPAIARISDPPNTARAARPPTDVGDPREGGEVPLDFTAIDFETANSSSASACAVGLSRVRDGRVVATDGWLIQPPAGHDRFFELNTGIHGIRADDVVGAPGWSAQLSRLTAFIGDDVVVAHNAGFDMTVLRRACEATADVCPPYRYVCSLQISRKTYELASYRLPFVAAAAGFLDFAHHDAAADALACAHIVIDAARRAGAGDVVELAMLLGVRVPQISVEAPAPATTR